MLVSQRFDLTPSSQPADPGRRGVRPAAGSGAEELRQPGGEVCGCFLGDVVAAVDGLAAHVVGPFAGKPATSCPDWTERRPHLGALGAAILDSALARAYWVRKTGHRTLTITPAGRKVLTF